jgi:methylaspartate ammonia-lyase
MRIVKLIASEGVGGSYCTDQEAVAAGAKVDGVFVRGKPVLPGFKTCRDVASAVCLQLVLEDGQVAHGDGTSLVYPGRGGADPPFEAADLVPVAEGPVAKFLVGQPVEKYRTLARELDDLRVDGKRMHSALRWGLGNALLEAVALARKLTKAEVLAEEWGTTLAAGQPRLNVQHGLGWDLGIDKAILRRVGTYHRATHNRPMWEDHPRALKLFRDRLVEFGGPGVRVDIQLDMNGFGGRVFDNDVRRIAAYMAQLERDIAPVSILFGSPVEMPDRATQIAKLVELRGAMRSAGVRGELVADHWCLRYDDHVAFAEAAAADYHAVRAVAMGSVHETMDALVYVKRRGLKTWLSGTATSTDRSGQTLAHIALATQPDLLTATPGGGIDEGHSIAVNEVSRTLALIRARRVTPSLDAGRPRGAR